MQRQGNQALTRYYLQDLVVSIRCARRDGQDGYAQVCVDEFRALWPHRLRAVLDRYGVPRPPPVVDLLSK